MHRNRSHPLITLDVIVPVLNGAEFLEKALHSIDNQHVQPDRVILLDNCSSDGTLAIMKNWASNKVNVEIHHNPQLLGFADNWNHALSLAKSEFVHFLAYDDELHPTLIKNVKKMAKRFTGTTGFIFRVDVSDENGQKGFKKIPIPFEYDLTPRKHLKKLITRNTFNLAGAVFRREKIASLNFMDSRYSIWSDWVLWQNILLHGSLTRSLRIASTYRIHSNIEKKLERKNLVSQDLDILINSQLPLIFNRLNLENSEIDALTTELISKTNLQSSI